MHTLRTSDKRLGYTAAASEFAHEPAKLLVAAWLLAVLSQFH